MVRSLPLILLALAIIAVAAVPLEDSLKPAKRCSKVRVRKEWHDLSTKDKKAWIAGIKCMQRTPGVYKNVHDIEHLTAYEDYTYEHKTQTTYVHWNTVFLTWHRYLLWSFENTMRDKCGYKGSMPYWDQTLDTADSRKSDVFSPDHGFGGNGEYIAVLPTVPGGLPPPTPLPPIGEPSDNLPENSGGGCVMTGPFSAKNYIIRTGKLDNMTRDDHCLARDLNPRVTALDHSLEDEEVLYKIDDYAKFHYQLEGMPTGDATFNGVHGSGHYTYAGNRVVDGYSSPEDPMFFMHHANIDRIWHDWQITDRKNRLYQLSYPVYPVTPVMKPDPALDKGIIGGLDYPVNMGKLRPEVLVNDLMDTKAGFLCYEYARSSKRKPVKGK